MERLKERLTLAHKALKSFIELATIEQPTDVERDASIQRFEYSFEAIWKAAKGFLLEIEANSPKKVIRECFKVGLLSDSETQQALIMSDDRNLTSHTYNEPLAKEIHQRIGAHSVLLKQWLEQMIKRSGLNVDE